MNSPPCFEFDDVLPCNYIFVIFFADEANKLMRWHELDPSRPNLEILLSFLTAITKQDNLAHVVLATSDYFLASWLYDRRFFGSIFIQVFELILNRSLLV
jgi:hypothetical protein